MAADAWRLYDTVLADIGKEVINLETDVFKCALFLSTSNAATASLINFGDLTNEHAAANGYTAGGNTMTGTGVTNVNTDDAAFTGTIPLFTAAGGSIIARFGVIYDDTHASKRLIAWSLLDNLPDDVTIATGNSLNLTMNANGMFRWIDAI